MPFPADNQRTWVTLAPCGSCWPPSNAHKVVELRRILAAAGIPVDLTGLDEFPAAPDVAETGLTFAENALLKARAIAAVHGAAVGRRRLRPVRRRAGRHAGHLFRALVRPAR